MSRYSSRNGKIIIGFTKNYITIYKSSFRKLNPPFKEIEDAPIANLLSSLFLFEDYFKVENLVKWNDKEGDEYLDFRIFFDEKLVQICSPKDPSYKETLYILLNELHE